MNTEFDFGKKRRTAKPATNDNLIEKKKPSKKKPIDLNRNENPTTEPDFTVHPVSEPLPVYEDLPDYSYEDMLKNITDKFSDQTEKKLVLPQPKVVKSKKTKWINFSEFPEALNRTIDHLKSFFDAECGCDCFMDSKNRLTLNGSFTSQQIENVLFRYVENHIKCKNCKSKSTSLIKEKKINFVCCNDCGNRVADQKIKKGHQAVRKGERKKEREK